MWQISFCHVTPLVVHHFPPTLPHYLVSLAVVLVWLIRRRLVAAIAVRWSAVVVVVVVVVDGGGSVYGVRQWQQHLVASVAVVVVYCFRGVFAAPVKWTRLTMAACPCGTQRGIMMSKWLRKNVKGWDHPVTST